MTHNGTRVAEYSTELDYFKHPYVKITRDVGHAIRQCANIQQLLLMASVNCTNTELKGAVGAAHAAAQPKVSPNHVQVWPAQEIARHLYDLFVLPDKPICVLLAKALPECRRLLHEHPYDHALPTLPDSYARDIDNFTRLSDAVAQSSVVEVTGLSGSGKTLLIADWAEETRGNWSTVTWLRAETLPPQATFRSVVSERGGSKLNLVSRISHPKSLLLLDDHKGDVSPLVASWKEHAGEGSRLVLSRHTPSGSYSKIVLSSVSKSTARRILPPSISDSTLEKVYRFTGGLPLAIAILSSLIRDFGSAEEDLEDLLAQLPEAEDETGTSLASRLLRQHPSRAIRDLNILKWFGSQRVEVEFLRSTLGSVRTHNLTRRGLLQTTGGSLNHIHDLVWAALPLGDSVEEEARELLYTYFASNASHKVRSVRAMLGLLQPRIHSLTVDDPGESLWTYLTLQGEVTDERGAALERLAEATPPETATFFEWATWVEAVEHYTRPPSQEALQEPFAVKMERRANSALDETVVSLLAHHAAKLYRKSRNYDAADRCFSLACKVREYPEARLGQARLAVDRGRRGEAELLLESLLTSRDSIGISVALAAYEETPNFPRLLHEYVVARFGDFTEFVLKAATGTNFSQPDRTIRAVSRALEYSAPALVDTIAYALDLPEPADLVKKRELEDWGEFYLIWGASNRKCEGQWRNQVAKSAMMYEQAEPTKPYPLARYAKALLMLNQHRRVLEMLAGQEDKFCQFYYAQAVAIDGDPAKACAILEPLAAKLDSPTNRYVWDFYRWIGRAHALQGHTEEASVAFERALQRCPSDSSFEREDLANALKWLRTCGMQQ